MGRIKEISRRPTRSRKRNPVVYLICEGSETEIRYFKRFRSRGCNIDIIPISSQYKSADRLVQKAKATMGVWLGTTNGFKSLKRKLVQCIALTNNVISRTKPTTCCNEAG